MWVSFFEHISHGYVFARIMQDSGLLFYTGPQVADAYINMLFAQIFSKFKKF